MPLRNCWILILHCTHLHSIHSKIFLEVGGDASLFPSQLVNTTTQIVCKQNEWLSLHACVSWYLNAIVYDACKVNTFVNSITTLFAFSYCLFPLHLGPPVFGMKAAMARKNVCMSIHFGMGIL